MKQKNTLLLIALMLLVTLTACRENPSETGQDTQPVAPQDTSGVQDIGQGSTIFLFEATDDIGAVKTWNVHTDETTVGAALLTVGLIEGDESDFGLMVTHVNGIRADYVEDAFWWALYINDEMAMIGVDALEIKPGVTYSFVRTAAG